MRGFAKALTTFSLGGSLFLLPGVVRAEPQVAVAARPSDVATLRQLLALQYPLLQKAGASPEQSVSPPETVDPHPGETGRKGTDRGA